METLYGDEQIVKSIIEDGVDYNTLGQVVGRFKGKDISIYGLRPAVCNLIKELLNNTRKIYFDEDWFVVVGYEKKPSDLTIDQLREGEEKLYRMVKSISDFYAEGLPEIF